MKTQTLKTATTSSERLSLELLLQLGQLMLILLFCGHIVNLSFIQQNYLLYNNNNSRPNNNSA